MYGMELLIHYRWSLVLDKQFHLKHYWACDYLFMLGSKLIYADKNDPGWLGQILG